MLNSVVANRRQPNLYNRGGGRGVQYRRGLFKGVPPLCKRDSGPKTMITLVLTTASCASSAPTPASTGRTMVSARGAFGSSRCDTDPTSFRPPSRHEASFTVAEMVTLFVYFFHRQFLPRRVAHLRSTLHTWYILQIHNPWVMDDNVLVFWLQFPVS